jgi:hypothetical protein
MFSLLFAVFGTVLSLAILAWIVLRIHRALRPEDIDPGWWEHFEPGKYSPLEHLFTMEDFLFLQSQQACGPRLLWSFRRERARICLRFLQEMKADFERLQTIGQALVIANRCSPGFHEELFRRRLRFSLAWWQVRLLLPLWRLGLAEPDASPLLLNLERSASAVRFAIAPAA